MPKFKGGSDDWLDDEDKSTSKATPRKKKIATKAKPLDPSEANATVAEVFPNQCRVILDQAPASGKTNLLCRYRRSTVIGQKGEQEVRERAPVAVGDRVLVKLDIVEAICERSSRLARPAPDRGESQIHVIVANVEKLVIVTSALNPGFIPGLVDRFLIAAAAENITPIICINKIDLADETISHAWDLYRRIGYDVLEVSAKQAVGVEELRARIEGARVVFCGHSGVGKTSLLRTLLSKDIGRIGDVSEATGKGKHTTTSAVLLQGSSGNYASSWWIDTPGIKEFGLYGIPPEEIKSYFREFEAKANECQLGQDCLHIDEAGCSVREASFDRYSSYCRIYKSLLE